VKDIFRRFRIGKRNVGTGISVGKDVIRLVELARRGRGIVLNACGEIELTPGCFAESGEILKPDELCSGLEELVEISKINNKEVVTAVHGEMVVIRQFFLPSMPDDELQSAVRWEAENYIPFDLSDVEMDYVKVAEEEEEGSVQINVMVVAVPKSLVWQYYDVFTRCGLDLLAIEVEPVALSRIPALLNDDNFLNTTQAVIDLGERNTNITILSHSKIHFTRVLSMGVKETWGKFAGKTAGENALLEEELEGITREIERSLSYYRVQSKGSTVEQILLTGIGAKLPDIQKVLSIRFNIPVRVMELHVQRDGDGVLLQPEYGIAAGLAYREVG